MPCLLPYSALALVLHPTKSNDAIIDADNLSIMSDMLNFNVPATPSIPFLVLEDDECVDDLIRLAREDSGHFTV